MSEQKIKYRITKIEREEAVDKAKATIELKVDTLEDHPAVVVVYDEGKKYSYDLYENGSGFSNALKSKFGLSDKEIEILKEDMEKKAYAAWVYVEDDRSIII